MQIEGERRWPEKSSSVRETSFFVCVFQIVLHKKIEEGAANNEY